MINIIYGMIIGSWITYAIIKHFFRLEKPHPYRWVCPKEECKLEISTTSNAPNLLMTLIERHENFHKESEI